MSNFDDKIEKDLVTFGIYYESWSRPIMTDLSYKLVRNSNLQVLKLPGALF